MPDALGEAKLRLAGEIDSHPALPSEPIAADAWVLSSPAEVRKFDELPFQMTRSRPR
jgi:hypothetical protein